MKPWEREAMGGMLAAIALEAGADRRTQANTCAEDHMTYLSCLGVTE
jgi:hypothetical protein